MSHVNPSAIVQAIDQMFGPNRNELDQELVNYYKRSEVITLLSMLDDLPQELLTLPAQEYLEFCRGKASLRVAVSVWMSGAAGPAAQQVGARDPVSVIRRNLTACPDELPPKVMLEFVDDPSVCAWIVERAQAAWVDFAAFEWLGCTVMAGAAVEGLLLWMLDRHPYRDQSTKVLNKADLGYLVDFAETSGVLTKAVAAQARMAKDARNLVHPGRVERDGGPASRGEALAALAALDLVLEAARDLSKST